ncbi:MAG: SRPBCC domain-containing protein [Anaerolineaceae bacterium]
MTFTAKNSTLIIVSPAAVWDALINSATIKEYMFGTEVVTDWQVGHPILYRGSWEGKPYEDKGTILKIEPEKTLICNYWSSFSGLEDKPENYQTVSYELKPEGGNTRLTITQDNIPSEEGAKQSEQNWGMVLAGMKKLLEK